MVNIKKLKALVKTAAKTTLKGSYNAGKQAIHAFDRLDSKMVSTKRQKSLVMGDFPRGV